MNGTLKKERKIRQALHFQVSDKEHRAIHAIADEQGETVSAILRRLVRQVIQAGLKKVGTNPVQGS